MKDRTAKMPRKHAHEDSYKERGGVSHEKDRVTHDSHTRLPVEKAGFEAQQDSDSSTVPSNRDQPPWFELVFWILWDAFWVGRRVLEISLLAFLLRHEGILNEKCQRVYGDLAVS
jgi:hypothetical protein